LNKYLLFTLKKNQTMTKYIFFGAITMLLLSCGLSDSKGNILGDFISAEMKGLKAGNLFLEVDGSKRSSNIFDYGDEIVLKLENVSGFTIQNGKMYPGLEMIVINKNSDTLFYEEDLYKEDGYSQKYKSLFAKLTAANPMFTNETYTAIVNVWDKKGKAKMQVKYDFSTRPNPNLNVKAKSLSYDVIYVFSQQQNRVIKSKLFKKDDNVYFFLEGLKGFKEVNGAVFPMLQLTVKNEDGNVVLEEENLFKSYLQTGLDPESLAERVYFNINTISTVYKRLSIHAVLVDLHSDAAMMIDMELIREE
jgi:hypothetical protein